MDIFVLGADRVGAVKQTIRSINDIFPHWNVVPIQSGQIDKLNRGMIASDSVFCMTIRAGSLLLPAFCQQWDLMEQMMLEGLGWLELLPAEEEREYLEQFRSGESCPVLWNISQMSEPFPGNEILPFDAYIETFVMHQMQLYCRGQSMRLDNVWLPDRRKPIGWKRKEAEWTLIAPLLKHQKLIDECTSPAVSVLMAVYNDEQYLRWAVHSISCQTSQEWELILVDDGSELAAKNIIAKLADGDRVRVVRQAPNRGKAHALNLALAHARGRWVLELDADDWLTPDCIEKLLYTGEVASADVAFIYGNYYEWMEHRDGRLALSSSRVFNSSMSRLALLQQATPLAPRFYRTESLRSLGGWNVLDPSHGRMYEDMHLILRMMNHYQTHHVNECLYHRRIRPTSITRKHNDQYEHWSQWAINDIQTK